MLDLGGAAFVMFELFFIFGSPLVMLASLIADLVLLRRKMWRGALVVAAALNALFVLVWLGTVGLNLIGHHEQAALLARLPLGWMLVPALFLMPLANGVLFVGYAITARSRREHGSFDDGAAIGDASLPSIGA